MKQVAKQAFENNMHHHETMKTIAKAYLTNQECTRGNLPYFTRIETKKHFFSSVFS